MMIFIQRGLVTRDIVSTQPGTILVCNLKESRVRKYHLLLRIPYYSVICLGSSSRSDPRSHLNYHILSYRAYHVPYRCYNFYISFALGILTQSLIKMKIPKVRPLIDRARAARMCVLNLCPVFSTEAIVGSSVSVLLYTHILLPIMESISPSSVLIWRCSQPEVTIGGAEGVFFFPSISPNAV